MSASGGHAAILTRAMHDLMAVWDQTAPVWRDDARKSFDRDYVQNLLPAVRGASNAIQEIERFLHQVRKECS